MSNLSVKMRDTALTKRNGELRYLRRLVGQLKKRVVELEGNLTKRAADVYYCDCKLNYTVYIVRGVITCSFCYRPRR